MAPVGGCDFVAVAQVEPLCGAPSPQCELNVAREDFWKTRVEGAGINTVCDSSDDLRTAALRVAGRTIGVGDAAICVFRKNGTAVSLTDGQQFR